VFVRDVREAEAGIQVDQVHPHLEQPHQRDAAGRKHPPGAVRHVRPPVRAGHPVGGQVEPVAGGEQVFADHLGQPLGALLDVRVPVRPARVHRVLDPGARPGHQVDQGVGVAAEVGDQMTPGPAG